MWGTEFELSSPPVASRLLTMDVNTDSTFDVKDQNQKLKFVLEPAVDYGQRQPL